MVCFKVSSQFAFWHKQPALVSTHITQTKAPKNLVKSGMVFGHRLTIRRWFYTHAQALHYAAYLQGMYQGRTFPALAAVGGQQFLFQGVH